MRCQRAVQNQWRKKGQETGQNQMAQKTIEEQQQRKGFKGGYKGGN